MRDVWEVGGEAELRGWCGMGRREERVVVC